MGADQGGAAKAGSGVRARMVEGAVRLLATKGVEGTSFAEVLAATDSPRGSIYHHFPGGKPELLHAALDLASERGLAAMEATRGQPAVAVVQRFLGLWRELLDRSRLKAGCAVVAVTVAAADDDLLDHAGTIFRTWTERLTELCAAAGMNQESARRLAVTVIAATEGAVALCRAERSREPFEEVSATLLSLAGQAAALPAGRRLRQGLVQAREVADHAVEAGERENAKDRSTGDDQQQLAAFGLGALMRREQGMEPGRIAEPGQGHVGHERPGPVRGGRLQGRAQFRGVGDVDLLRRRHDRHAANQFDGEHAVLHLRHLP